MHVPKCQIPGPSNVVPVGFRVYGFWVRVLMRTPKMVYTTHWRFQVMAPNPTNLQLRSEGHTQRCWLEGPCQSVGETDFFLEITLVTYPLNPKPHPKNPKLIYTYINIYTYYNGNLILSSSTATQFVVANFTV